MSAAATMSVMSTITVIAGCRCLSGVAREVYQGKALSFTVTNLKPAGEYVFCVKATYDDGSHVWSDSKAFSTKS